MPTRTVRPATAADVVPLVELRHLMFTAMGVDDVDRPAWQRAAGRWFREAADRQDVRVLVAEVDGEVVASALAQLRHGCPSPGAPTGVTGDVSSVCTAPGARHQGHARACTEAALDWLRDQGAERAELRATPEGRPLYEALGFRETATPTMRRALP